MKSSTNLSRKLFDGLFIAVLGLLSISLAHAQIGEIYVGSWEVDQGPTWTEVPPAYSGQTAAVLLFGSSTGDNNPADYQISTVSSDPAQINDEAWYSVYGGGPSGGNGFPEGYTYAQNYLPNPVYTYPAASAYVNDWAVGSQYTNYAFITGLVGAYWLGNTSNVWTDQNWASDSSGTPTTLTPTSVTDVTFSATGAANQTTTLGADTTIKSLTINDPTAVTIGGAYTLTISGSSGTTGITVNSGAGLFTISSNLALGGSSQTISINNAAGAIISGSISSTIGLTKTGDGELTLTGANTYTGGTLFGNTGDLTAGTVEIGDGVADDGSTPASPTAITPLGLLTGSSGGVVTVNAPTTLTTDGAATGNSYSIANPFFLNPPLTVNVPTATSLTMTGEIFGSDGLTVNAGGATTGTLILSGDNGNGTFDNSGGATTGQGNIYQGATLLQGGTLQAATGSGTGNAFSPNSDYTLTGTSTLDLNGNSNTIASLASAVTTTTVTNNGGANAILTVDDTNSSLSPKTYTYAGLITDGTTNTLGLMKAGTGALTLTDANLYSGGTTINGGTLVVGNATALGIVGTLGGTGNVTNNATLETTASSPLATAPLAIMVAGAYTQTTGTLLLQVATDQGPAPTTSAVAGTDYDTLAATGTAAINGGALDLNFEGGVASHAGQRFQLVSSAAGPVTPIPPTISVTLTGTPFLGITTYNDSFGGTYATNNVVVTLFQPFTTFAGLTPNQTTVAGNIDAGLIILNNSGSLAIPTGVNADFFNNIITGLTAAANAGNLGPALDQLSPQRFEILHNVAFDNYAFDVQSLDQEFARERMGFGGVDTAGFTFNNSELGPQLSQVRSRLLAWSPAPEPGLLSDSSQAVLGSVKMADPKDMKEMTPETPEQLFSVFIDGGVDLGDKDGNDDESRSSYTTGRVRVGADYRVCKDVRVGMLFGYNHTDADLDNEGSNAHVDGYTPGIFLTYADKDGFYANGLFTYTDNEYSTSRDIVIPGVNRSASGSFSGDQFGGDLDGGYDFHRGDWTFGPSLGLTYVNLGIDSFTESGAGAANLAVNSQSTESLRSRLGGTVSYRTEIGSVVLTPYVSAFWQHEFLDNSTNITSSFVGLPGGAFAVQTTAGDSDNALLGAGLNAELNQTLTLFIDYGAEAGGSSFFGQSATGGVKVAF